MKHAKNEADRVAGASLWATGRRREAPQSPTCRARHAPCRARAWGRPWGSSFRPRKASKLMDFRPQRHVFHRFSSIFIDFHGFSLILLGFLWASIEFLSICIHVHRVFIGFHSFSSRFHGQRRKTQVMEMAPILPARSRKARMLKGAGQKLFDKSTATHKTALKR